ncbi:MAG: DUF2235 domain-containing protein [Acidimicrobiia bacterium]|nr:DUF2235 domain-containing protein [Acidimicrobiia bacterium]
MRSKGDTGVGKNIVVFADGTGQEGGEGTNTNVYKLFQMIEDRTPAQMAFYDPGLGTGWRKVTGNTMGFGISKNVLDCYQFISDHYQWGDRIFLFGFSRGATTVRSLSGFITRFGVLPHSRPDLAKKAWTIYKIPDKTRREEAARDFTLRNTTAWCNIDFLGVWDTVEALGIPFVDQAVNAAVDRLPGFQHSFHDLKISKCVHHAVHALSIDENRADFLPTPWHTEDNGKSTLGEIFVDPRFNDATGRTIEDLRQTVRQVWFSGSHTDVGGGYAECGLGNIPLAWMIDCATDPNLMDYPLRVFPYSPVVIEQDIEDVMHDERNTDLKKRLFREGLRSWDVARGGRPVIHESVLERVKLVDDYRPWILDEFGEGDYDVAPWDNRDAVYSIPFELDSPTSSAR